MDAEPRKPFLPPRWFIRTAWVAHRALYRGSAGRLGLRTPKVASYGLMRVHTTGRRSGAERIAILAYLEDGPNLVTMAMNGWGDPEPAWWLNLQARPEAVVELPGERRDVRARAADGDERARLWAQWARYDEGLDQYAAMRSRETAVVVLEPRAARSADEEAQMQDETTMTPEPEVQATRPNWRTRPRPGAAPKPGGADGGAVFGLGMIGAAAYFFTTATTPKERVLAFPKALVWPAILVYLALRRLGA